MVALSDACHKHVCVSLLHLLLAGQQMEARGGTWFSQSLIQSVSLSLSLSPTHTYIHRYLQGA